MSVTQEPLDPPIETDDVDDVMLMSAGPRLSARNRDDDVMLTSAALAPHVSDPDSLTVDSPIDLMLTLTRPTGQ